MYTNAGLSNGVTAQPGSGSWSSASDRNLKSNVVPANGQEILARLNTIPIATWNYISQDPSIRHIGPMAQDFYTAFNVGEDERHITTIDSEGVALAAIQGLYQVTQEKDVEIGKLKAQSEKQQAKIVNLEERLTALEHASAPIARSDKQSIPTTWVLFGGLIVVGLAVVRRRE